MLVRLGAGIAEALGISDRPIRNWKQAKLPGSPTGLFHVLLYMTGAHGSARRALLGFAGASYEVNAAS
jgi:hypothetical protein